MSDITHEEAAWFNEDCAIVEARIRDWLPISPLTERQEWDCCTSAIVRQLWLRWFGFDSMDIEQTRALRNLLGIGPGNETLGTLPPHA